MADIDNKKQKGDKISAAEWNATASAAKQITTDQFFDSGGKFNKKQGDPDIIKFVNVSNNDINVGQNVLITGFADHTGTELVMDYYNDRLLFEGGVYEGLNYLPHERRGRDDSYIPKFPSLDNVIAGGVGRVRVHGIEYGQLIIPPIFDNCKLSQFGSLLSYADMLYIDSKQDATRMYEGYDLPAMAPLWYANSYGTHKILAFDHKHVNYNENSTNGNGIWFCARYPDPLGMAYGEEIKYEVAPSESGYQIGSVIKANVPGSTSSPIWISVPYGVWIEYTKITMRYGIGHSRLISDKISGGSQEHPLLCDYLFDSDYGEYAFITLSNGHITNIASTARYIRPSSFSNYEVATEISGISVGGWPDGNYPATRPRHSNIYYPLMTNAIISNRITTIADDLDELEQRFEQLYRQINPQY